MLRFSKSAVVALLGLAAVAGPAKADLIIKADGATVATDTTNTFTSWTCTGACSMDGFTINLVSITGVNGTGGNPLMDNGALDVASSAHGTLTLDLTETNLTAGSAAQFLMAFTGTTTSLDVTRTFYLDTTNNGLNTITLATFSTIGTASFSQEMLSLLQSLSGPFSITEEIVLSSGRTAGSISEDDKITVPEPAALSLFGLGLLALGGMAWRRRSGNPAS
jgi:hypothetical protein